MARLFFCLGLCSLTLLSALDATPALAERQDYVGGTGNSVGGFSGSYTDPTTDENVTIVIAPRKSEQQQPNTPIYIYPQVTPQWPPNPGPQPSPIPTPSDKPIAPLPSTPSRPVGPDISPSGGGTIYSVPSGERPSPPLYNKGR